MTGSEVGIAVGLLIGLGGTVGTVLGGWLSDLAGRRDVRWTLWLSAIVFATAVPFYFVTTLTTNKWLALVAFIYPGMIAIFPSGPIGAALQGLVKLRMRSMITAIFLLVTNLIGIGLGPLVIGLISDSLTTRYGDESLRYALTLIPFFMLWSALHLVLAARTLRADLARAQAD
jgi:MFS family permease